MPQQMQLTAQPIKKHCVVVIDKGTPSAVLFNEKPCETWENKTWEELNVWLKYMTTQNFHVKKKLLEACTATTWFMYLHWYWVLHLICIRNSGDPMIRGEILHLKISNHTLINSQNKIYHFRKWKTLVPVQNLKWVPAYQGQFRSC